MSVIRFGVSLESELLDALDEYVSANHFPNRSQAIRHLVERNVAERKWQCNSVVSGAIVLVYDQTRRDVVAKLAAIQSEYAAEILSVQRFYFSPQTCFETVAVRGQSYKLTELADQLIPLKGIRHGRLAMTNADDHP